MENSQKTYLKPLIFIITTNTNALMIIGSGEQPIESGTQNGSEVASKQSYYMDFEINEE